MATTTFEQPGEYLICVRADSFGRIDSSAGNQCCWTNGYVKGHCDVVALARLVLSKTNQISSA